MYECQLDKAVRPSLLTVYLSVCLSPVRNLTSTSLLFYHFQLMNCFIFFIVIKMDRKSAGDDGLTFPDFANPRVNRWDARHDVIALPSSVFAQSKPWFLEWNTSVPSKPIFYGTIAKQIPWCHASIKYYIISSVMHAF